MQSTTTKWLGITITRQYHWISTFQRQIDWMRHMITGVCNSTEKSFGEVIQQFIYGGMKYACNHMKMESPKWLVEIIGRITSASIRTLTCQSQCTGLDLLMALLVLQYFYWKGIITKALTATISFDRRCWNWFNNHHDTSCLHDRIGMSKFYAKNHQMVEEYWSYCQDKPAMVDYWSIWWIWPSHVLVRGNTNAGGG